MNLLNYNKYYVCLNIEQFISFLLIVIDLKEKSFSFAPDAIANNHHIFTFIVAPSGLRFPSGTHQHSVRRPLHAGVRLSKVAAAHVDSGDDGTPHAKLDGASMYATKLRNVSAHD